MSEFIKTTREMCLRQTEDNFYLVVSRPFHPQLTGYRRFRDMAARCVVKTLEEGSQVFVYPRDEFGSDAAYLKNEGKPPLTDTDMFLERTVLTAQELSEDIIIDPSIENVEAKATPLSQPDNLIQT